MADISHTNPQHIEGIQCDVANCTYNEKQSFCTAKNIKVGPQFASSSNETACVTFKPRS